MRDGGRIVVVGTGAGSDARVDLRSLMKSRSHLIGTVLRTRTDAQKSVAVASFGNHVVPLIAARRLAPVIDQAYDISEVGPAFERLAAPGKFGKVLINFPSRRSA
jgi:NADPH:quinone reductase-like Zn-dependent oxidoreductase